MTDLAEVVCKHCGGDVRNQASPLDATWYVGIHWDDSVPEGGGVWASYDQEADFEHDAGGEESALAF